MTTTNPIRILVRDPAAVNFDAICRVAIEIVHVLMWPLGDIVVVRDGDHDIDIEGDERDRKYWECGGRSMTELYATRMGLGEADDSGLVLVKSSLVGPGLVNLCQALAENHGRVRGVKGGALNDHRSIFSIAKGLPLMPERASEIVTLFVRGVVAALRDKHPIAAFIAAADPKFGAIHRDLAAASLRLYEQAKLLVVEHDRKGMFFPLAGLPHAFGMRLVTDQPDLPRHVWSAIRHLGMTQVAVLVVVNPATGRLAVLTSDQYPALDVGPVVAELKKLFHGANFSVDERRGMIVWDPRSQERIAHRATADDFQSAVAERLALYQAPPAPVPVPSPGLGAKLGDAVRVKSKQPKKAKDKKGQPVRQ